MRQSDRKAQRGKNCKARKGSGESEQRAHNKWRKKVVQQSKIKKKKTDRNRNVKLKVDVDCTVKKKMK